jgi:hypothetical protein
MRRLSFYQHDFLILARCYIDGKVRAPRRLIQLPRLFLYMFFNPNLHVGE